MNEIISAAVHDLNKDAGNFTIVLGKPIAAANPLTQKVVDTLYSLYASRRTASRHTVARWAR